MESLSFKLPDHLRTAIKKHLFGSTEGKEGAKRAGLSESQFIDQRLNISDERSLQSYFIFHYLPPALDKQSSFSVAYLLLEISNDPINLSIILTPDARSIKAEKNQRVQISTAFGPHSSSKTITTQSKYLPVGGKAGLEELDVGATGGSQTIDQEDDEEPG